MDKYRSILKEGEWLFHEGDQGDTAFVIENGLLEICRERDGERERVAQLGAGELIGEMSLIDRLPRSASAYARIPTRLRILTREHLDEKLADADPLLRLLLKMILQRYRSSTSSGKASPEEAQKDRQAVIRRIELEHELEQALERQEFVLYFQPIVNLRSFTTAGFEALVRWVSPTRGFVPPGGFIPVAEESHLIHGLGKWILRKGCEVLKRLNDAGRSVNAEPVFMNINLSGKQLSTMDIFDEIRDAIADSGASPGQLKLEITESLLMNNLDTATELLNRCRDLGVRIALDDFGTGYSSLGYLRRLPINTLKVDRSFVAPLLDDPGSGKILGAICALGHSLGMDLVAEGIENQEQAIALNALGFEYGQGYLLSKAIPEEQARDLLTRKWPWVFERRRVDRRA